MGFRTVVVSSRVKLELKLNYLVCRGETDMKIHISEISTLIIQSTAVSLTVSLLCELVKNGIKIIFCDEKHNPQAELLPYYGSYNNSKRIQSQITWDSGTKAKIWQIIVKRKILEQAKILNEYGKTDKSAMLEKYANEVCENDATNREGHAAKVYFNALFGFDFTRDAENRRNAYLNYGYAVLLSAFNREISAQGYLTQIGIWHKNEYNDFNLACDLMEPFRPLVDRMALAIAVDDTDFKFKLADLLNKICVIDGQKTTVENAVKIYVRSVINALNDDNTDGIVFSERYEL